MEIRLTQTKDIPAVLALYEQAKEYMHSHGNPSQWAKSGPGAKSLKADMGAGISFVVEEGSKIIGTFALQNKPDENYAQIDGAWLNDKPYVTIHRIVSAQKGVGSYIIDEIKKNYSVIRIDTHKNNAAMHALLSKEGFRYCGVISLRQESGAKRDAYLFDSSIV